MRIFNSKHLTISASVILVAAIAVFTPNFASAEDQNQNKGKSQSQNSESGKQPELASTYDSKYWGTPSRDIANSSDQNEYQKGAPAIPGIEVATTEVFSTFPGKKAALAVPLGSGDLIDHGGQVLNEIHIYPIFWGPTSTTFSATYKQKIVEFFTNLQCGAGTSVSVCTGHSDQIKQYFRTPALKSASPIIKLGGVFNDLSNPPSSSPSTSTIIAEAAKVVKAMPGAVLDPLGFYMVFTSNYPARVNFCAWHSAGSYKASSTSTAIWYTAAYMPYVGTVSGCSSSSIPGWNGFINGQAVDSVVNVSTHELYETMSDSLLNNKYAWYDSKGYENGDKCAWYFGSTIGGYRVQSEYDNYSHTCPDKSSN